MIEVKDLHKSFGKLDVLRGITETIQDREVVCVIGPSGSGKSTFLRCLNLLEEPTSGTILVDGVEITDEKNDVNKIRENMGMVFQRFNLFPHMNVLDNITLAPMKVKGVDKAKAEAEAMELLKKVGLVEKANVYPDNLSGGQQQRVAIAR
ncbi:MAG: amino acid ABC transporter ATP-binding protein, partial [Peptococcaceae bacterium]|nr:amino acid ABC transporter ATP-binding protein [Peptococcaceae bacterium]